MFTFNSSQSCHSHSALGIEDKVNIDEMNGIVKFSCDFKIKYSCTAFVYLHPFRESILGSID